jgi:hypothetical protein
MAYAEAMVMVHLSLSSRDRKNLPIFRICGQMWELDSAVWGRRVPPPYREKHSEEIRLFHVRTSTNENAKQFTKNLDSSRCYERGAKAHDDGAQCN